MSSKPDTKLYALRSLLSVRWLVIEERNEEQSPMPGYSYVRTDGNFNLYENDHFVPMGFAFDHYITKGNLRCHRKGLPLPVADEGLLLEDDAIARHSDILTKLSDQQADTLSEDAFVADCADRRREASYEFTTDNRGFTSKIVLSKENLVFFSVPYDEGWSATVNGQPAQIEKGRYWFYGGARSGWGQHHPFYLSNPRFGGRPFGQRYIAGGSGGVSAAFSSVAPAACAIDFLYRTANAGGRTSAFF